MKLIIAGSRTIDSTVALHLFLSVQDKILGEHLTSTEFITGGCSHGPDQVPYLLQQEISRDILVTTFNPDWNLYGKVAGPIRNRLMAEVGDYLLLIWDGKSKGSANMKEEMLFLGKPVHEIVITEVIHATRG